MFAEKYYFPLSIEGDDCFKSGFARAISGNTNSILEYVRNIEFSEQRKCDYLQGIFGAKKYFLPERKGRKFLFK